MPPEFLREELDEEHDASYFAESDKILSFAFKSIKSPKIIVPLNGDFGKIWAGIGEEKGLSSTDKLISFQIISIYFIRNILVIKLLLAVADAIRLVAKDILKLLKEVLKHLFV